MKILKRFTPLIIVLVLSLWAVNPLFSSGFFPMHDDTQVGRVFEMHKALVDGMFPVRWVADLGYGFGYPIFNFYAPLAYYIGAAFMFLGFDALVATKLMIGSGVILAGVSMYLFARELWDESGAIIAGMLYLYAPYHGVNIYVRGAVAELWAYAFIPLVFLGIYRIYTGLRNYVDLETQSSKFKVQSSKLQLKIKKSIWNWVCISAISYAGIVTSHNLTAMMVTPFIFIFAAFLYIKLRIQNKIHKPYFVFLGLLIGILLSAFYWLPVLFEMKFTNVLSVVGGGSDFRDHFVCLPQLWNSPWGFGGSVPGCVDGLSYKIGKLHLLLGAISLLVLIPIYRKEKTKFQLIILFLVFLTTTTFFTLKESQFIWAAIPHMAFFQFPWRFLALVSFFLSLVAGAVVILLPKAKKMLILGVTAIIIAVLIFSSTEMFVPQKFIPLTASDYTSKRVLYWTTSRISDEYMPKDFVIPIYLGNPPESKIVKSKDIKIQSVIEKTQIISFITNAEKNVDLSVNLAYFPGWHVFVDNKQIEFKYSNKGLIIPVPSGEHKIEIKFIQTPVEKISNTISLAGVILLLAGIISHRKKLLYG